MDIETSAEVRILVDRFYEKVRRDPLIGPIFDEVAKVDWPSHLATLYVFLEKAPERGGGKRDLLPRSVSDACEVADAVGETRRCAHIAA